MDVRNCKKCKRLFNYIAGEPLCPTCREELEKKFQEVKKYLQEHRGASLAQTAEDCDVDEHQIRQWIREERLELMSGIDTGITCEACGTPIATGKYCEKCKASMINDLSAAGRRPVQAETPKMDSRTHENRMRFINTK